MKLQRTTVRNPHGSIAYRLYEYGPFAVCTWPGGSNRDAKPSIRQGKQYDEVRRRHCAAFLRALRELAHYAP